MFGSKISPLNNTDQHMGMKDSYNHRMNQIRDAE